MSDSAKAEAEISLNVLVRRKDEALDVAKAKEFVGEIVQEMVSLVSMNSRGDRSSVSGKHDLLDVEVVKECPELNGADITARFRVMFKRGGEDAAIDEGKAAKFLEDEFYGALADDHIYNIRHRSKTYFDLEFEVKAKVTKVL